MVLESAILTSTALSNLEPAVVIMNRDDFEVTSDVVDVNARLQSEPLCVPTIFRICDGSDSIHQGVGRSL